MSGLVIAGYTDIGYRCTKWLLDAGEEVKLIYTHPDAPGEQRWWDSMADLGKERGVPVRLVDDLDDPSEEARIRTAAPDFLFSFYFRKMIPARILAIPARGALNMHGSLLPLFRGRSPVNWAVIKGATETGATLHYMTEKPDAGDVVDQERVRIGPDDEILTVARRVGDTALAVLTRTWPVLKAGKETRRPLNLAAGSYFGARAPEDGRIDWSHPAKEIHDLVRAVTRPWPGAHTDIFGKGVTIWRTRLSRYGGHDVFPGKVEMTENSVIVYAGDDKPVEILLARPEGGPDLDAAGFCDWLLRQN